ncbi:DUF934 domain-containing protein [Sedimentimonas flavescens]|uniref:DUF934 domain-containing protein n=1 Tax=Sedimentimonas flavescens TaxID=2851012 RepID=A0ABT2ZY12_9RHOB|nr:DUF934 domain-containing protein [Sedimentimonas flavescens]MCV2878641.1 DUF934 domain-containing protein [Sedimentimonas flavescens]WBL31831.1 DUF934 domain-containing protein [Sinirhodobacter sp. HNIBRBA609]
MSVIVRDDGFHAEDWAGAVVELAPDTDAGELAALTAGAELVRVAFPAFSDGRGFTLGRRLRALGFTGRLRAAGHVIADQYAMARRSGFDEVEISDELAARQPEAQWKARADWQAHEYRARLRG